MSSVKNLFKTTMFTYGKLLYYVDGNILVRKMKKWHVNINKSGLMSIKVL